MNAVSCHPQSMAKQSVCDPAIRPPTPPQSPALPAPRTIFELISIRARQFPDERILGYPSHDTEYVEYTFAQLEALSLEAAEIYSEQLPVRTRSDENAGVIALLGLSNLDYVIATLALTRLGFTVLFLSTRISDTAYLSLLDATGCSHIIVDAAFRSKGETLVSCSESLSTHDIITFAQYASGKGSSIRTSSLPTFDLDLETTKVAWIIHSSGSTGLPKPILQTHQAALLNYATNMNMAGFITLPLFHAHGLSSVFRSITSVKKIYMQSASLPLTAQNLLNILRRNQWIEIVYGVPYAYKLLSETEEGIHALARMKACMFGGSACPDMLGNLLVDSGVNLISHYGTTETGQLMTSMRPTGDTAWNYVREHSKLKPYLRWEERGPSMYELVVLPGWPSKVATNRDDGAYATKDLFEPHPTIDGAWKYSSRLDDTIVLMNGEKAIPIAMEGAVRQQKLVKEAVMFGTGKNQLGMIVIAADAVASTNQESVVAAMWPIVQAQNRELPGYAQLTREMVQVLPSDTTYASTDKGTVIRQAFYRDFKEQIEAVYTQAETRAAGTLVLSNGELRSWLRKEISQLASLEDCSPVTDDTDLFAFGVDSLQSTRLRAKIMQTVQLNGNTLPQNVVFEYPTVMKLAQALEDVRDSRNTEAGDDTVEMERLIAKYSEFPQHTPLPCTSLESCIVVTGVTGSLGAHLVAQLTARSDVNQVCCLVRAKTDENARARAIRSMRERAVYHSLSLPQRRKITCFASDFSKHNLGLCDDVYNSISTRISSLIHCAWSVNFNKRLSSFELDCIAGARHLMLLCLSAHAELPASFNFCSSVSTVVNTPGDVVTEALPPRLECAQGMGYAQSKLVTENMVARAASSTTMKARVLRVGQIVADTNHGIWNDTEAIPLMMQAATTFGALPTLDERPRWLPVDEVARTCMDISLSSTQHSFFNIVNPHTFHWIKDLLPALHASGLDFDEVDQREWIRRLRTSDPDPSTNPTIKLADFFANKYDNHAARRSLEYATSAATGLSPILAQTDALRPGLVHQFVKHFLATSWSRYGITPTLAAHTQRLLVICGPAGSGNSTIAARLTERLGRDSYFIEGDSVHDAVSIAKMSQGTPLSELDRRIWLSKLKTEVLEKLRTAVSLIQASPKTKSASHTQVNIVLRCSALKRSHREALRDVMGDASLQTSFVLLEAHEEELTRRVQTRQGHYMKSNMVASQLASLEVPHEDETDVIPLDAADGAPEDQAGLILSILE